MPGVVHFGGVLNWDQEEEKSRRGARRRKERKQKRKKMKSDQDEQLRWVLQILLDPKCEGGVMDVFGRSEVARLVFDNMVMVLEIDTGKHSTRLEQLKEFREKWKKLTDHGKGKCKEYIGGLNHAFQQKFGLANSDSSEDEEEAQKNKAAAGKIGKRWFDVQTTESLRKSGGVGRLLFQNLPGGTFTAQDPSMFGKSDENEESDEDVKIPAAKPMYIVDDDDEEAATAQSQKKQKSIEEGDKKRPPVTEKCRRIKRKPTGAEADRKKPAAAASRKSARKKSPQQESPKKDKQGATARPWTRSQVKNNN